MKEDKDNNSTLAPSSSSRSGQDPSNTDALDDISDVRSVQDIYKSDYPGNPASASDTEDDGIEDDVPPEDDGIEDDVPPEDDGIEDDVPPEDDGIEDDVPPEDDGIEDDVPPEDDGIEDDEDIIGDEGGDNSDNKPSSGSRIVTLQSMFWPLIIAIPFLSICGIVSIVPLEGKKTEILTNLHSLGIKGDIQGKVHFNPFTLSFDANKVNLHAETVTPDSNHVSSVGVLDSRIQFHIINRKLTLNKGKIKVMTNGNTNQIYSLIKSLSATKLISSMKITDSLLSFSPCNVASQHNDTVSKVKYEGDMTFLSIPLRSVRMHRNKQSMSWDVNFNLEGENINLSYNHIRDKSISLSLNSGFANAMINADLRNSKTSRNNIGRYNVTISNGAAFTRTLGIPNISLYSAPLSRLNLRSSGIINFDINKGFHFTNPLSTSYGNGTLSLLFPLDRNDPIDLKLHFPIFNMQKNSQFTPTQDTTTKHIGIPELMNKIISNFYHRITFTADQFTTAGASLGSINLRYALKKCVLDTKDTFFSIKNDHFSLQSFKPKEHHFVSNNNSEQYIIDAKEKNRDTISTESTIPIDISGTDVVVFTKAIQSIFSSGYNHHPDPKPMYNPVPFKGSMELFMNYENHNYGAKNINIDTDNGGNIKALFALSKQTNHQDMLESVVISEITLSNLDISSIFDVDSVTGIVKVFKHRHGGAFTFNFLSNSSIIPNYSLNLTLQDVLYNSSSIEFLHTVISKTQHKFKISKFESKADDLNGTADFVFDMTNKEPFLNANLRFSQINVKSLFSKKLNAYKSDSLISSSSKVGPHDEPQNKSHSGTDLESSSTSSQGDHKPAANSETQLPGVGIASPTTSSSMPQGSQSSTAVNNDLSVNPNNGTTPSKSNSNILIEINSSVPNKNTQDSATNSSSLQLKRVNHELEDTNKSGSALLNYIGNKLELPYIDNLLGNVQLNIDHLILPKNKIEKFVFNGNIRESKFSIKKSSLFLNRSFIDISGFIFLRHQHKTKIDISTKDLPINPILSKIWFDNGVKGEIDMTARLYAEGRTFHSMLSNLNGSIKFNSHKLSISEPNIGMLYKLINGQGHRKKIDTSAVIRQPGNNTNFKTALGTINIINGSAKSENIVLRAIGYSGTTKFFINIPSASIDVCKTNFILLGTKPWVPRNNPDYFIKIPLSTIVIGNLHKPNVITSLDRVNEYINAVNEYYNGGESVSALKRKNLRG